VIRGIAAEDPFCQEPGQAPCIRVPGALAEADEAVIAIEADDGAEMPAHDIVRRHLGPAQRVANAAEPGSLDPHGDGSCVSATRAEATRAAASFSGMRSTPSPTPAGMAAL